jgi:hypothetical protein
MKILTVSSLLVVINWQTLIPAVFGQTTERTVVEFLERDGELRDYAASGYTSTFTGQFRPIPESIRHRLGKVFSRHTFAVAKMKVIVDLPPKNYDLIVIADKAGTVVGFVWADYSVLRPSKSFPTVFKALGAEPGSGAKELLSAFADLLAFAADERVGGMKAKNGRISIELMRGDGVSALLQATMTDKDQIRKIAITSSDGRALRYFTP